MSWDYHNIGYLACIFTYCICSTCKAHLYTDSQGYFLKCTFSHTLQSMFDITACEYITCNKLRVALEGMNILYKKEINVFSIPHVTFEYMYVVLVSYTHMYVHSHTHTHTCTPLTHAHTHTCTHTHTHTLTLKCVLSEADVWEASVYIHTHTHATCTLTSTAPDTRQAGSLNLSISVDDLKISNSGGAVSG